MKMVEKPNIVRYHEVMAGKSKIYIAMEFVRGVKLFNKISRGQLREEAAVVRVRAVAVAAITRTIVEVAQVCHKHEAIYRDFKLFVCCPANTLYLV